MSKKYDDLRDIDVGTLTAFVSAFVTAHAETQVRNLRKQLGETFGKEWGLNG